MKGLATVGIVLAAATANVALAAPRAMQVHDHDHDHDHGDESCACHSAHSQHTFSLDCAESDLIAASATTLQGCAVTSAACHAVEADGSEPCQTAFFHIYYVHGACPHDTLTEAQENLVHQYEDVCASCGVQRPYDSAVEACATPTEAECEATGDSNAAIVAAAALAAAVEAGIAACSDEATIASWKTLLAYHDLCEHDALPVEVENAVHTYEDACEDNFCNTVDASFDPAVCVEEEDDGHDHDHAEEVVDCNEHDHDHRRRLGGDHDHEEDPCAHTSAWVWVLLVVVILGAIGGIVFMKVKGLGCFAEDEKGSSG